MKEVVIVDAVRTPVGNHGGMLMKFTALDLTEKIIKGLLDFRNERRFRADHAL